MHPSNTIQQLSRLALDRQGIAPTAPTLERLQGLMASLDAAAPGLDELDQLALKDAAIEYTVHCATAETFESYCREYGPMLESGRINPAFSQAATARTRMRQALKVIQKLMKQAEKTPKSPESLPEPALVPAAQPPIASIGEETFTDAPGAPERAHQPVAPPKNRAERRAQARLEAKQQRRLQKHLRRQSLIGQGTTGTGHVVAQT